MCCSIGYQGWCHLGGWQVGSCHKEFQDISSVVCRTWKTLDVVKVSFKVIVGTENTTVETSLDSMGSPNAFHGQKMTYWKIWYIKCWNQGVGLGCHLSSKKGIRAAETHIQGVSRALSKLRTTEAPMGLQKWRQETALIRRQWCFIFQLLLWTRSFVHCFSMISSFLSWFRCHLHLHLSVNILKFRELSSSPGHRHLIGGHWSCWPLTSPQSPGGWLNECCFCQA